MALSANRHTKTSISHCCNDSDPHISRDSCFNWVQLIVWYDHIPRTKKQTKKLLLLQQ